MSKRPLPQSTSSAPTTGPVVPYRDEDESHEHGAPPAYSGPLTPLEDAAGAAGGSRGSTSGTRTAQRSRVLAIPGLNFSAYHIPEGTLSKDQTTTTTHLAALSGDVRALVQFVREQARLPPRPEIRIVGQHDYGGTPTTDFDIRLNMMPYILPSSTSSTGQGGPSAAWSYLKVVEDGEMTFRGSSVATLTPETQKGPGTDGLEQWARRFIKDAATLKTFTLTRTVTNWNTTYLEGQIRTLIASTKYQGRVTVSFPISHGEVVVHAPLRMNKFFAGFLSAVMDTKRYEIVRTVWPYATLDPSSDGEQTRERTCAVQSEEAWWVEWKEAVRSAVLAKRTGWVSVDDVIEYAMSGGLEGRGIAGDKLEDWGVC
ncbi:MAG: hypothetical protein M4579_002386 [Chaenotheca gracillima]|nr:MAG: hypothetical protein M4579_002386 [Chaenotheca gracillima]